MENLRNYVQHCGLAIHYFSLPENIEGEGDTRFMKHGINIYSTREELEKDPKFSKRPVFSECTERINLVRTIRKYIEQLSSIHIEIRSLIEDNILKSRAFIEDIIFEYKDVNDNNALGLYACGADSTDPLSEVKIKVSLLLDWDDVRVSLISKNRKLTNNSKHYISGHYLQQGI
jgi:hypothetical protein